MSRLTLTTSRGPRVRLTGCPRCARPVVLDHAGYLDGDGTPHLDGARVALAQRLHLASCSG